MECEISQDADGSRIAVATEIPAAVAVVVVKPDGDSRIFRRRGVKFDPMAGGKQNTCWLVAELNGVRAYLDGGALVLTTQDLYP